MESLVTYMLPAPCLLSKQIIPDKFAIPFLKYFLGFMFGATFFSSLNMYKSYHQIEVAEKDRQTTALLASFGSYAFKKMPIGLTSAGNTLQRFMNEVLRVLDFVYVYTDDILFFRRVVKNILRALLRILSA